eukprot:Rhum_TRINITY_DN15289_c26_g1::Rhum_TRINITY_DN15289_c26_g1_i1::g.144556::m.144556
MDVVSSEPSSAWMRSGRLVRTSHTYTLLPPMVNTWFSSLLLKATPLAGPSPFRANRGWCVVGDTKWTLPVEEQKASGLWCAACGEMAKTERFLSWRPREWTSETFDVVTSTTAYSLRLPVTMIFEPQCEKRAFCGGRSWNFTVCSFVELAPSVSNRRSLKSGDAVSRMVPLGWKLTAESAALEGSAAFASFSIWKSRVPGCSLFFLSTSAFVSPRMFAPRSPSSLIASESDAPSSPSPPPSSSSDSKRTAAQSGFRLTAPPLPRTALALASPTSSSSSSHTRFLFLPMTPSASTTSSSSSSPSSS